MTSDITTDGAAAPVSTRKAREAAGGTPEPHGDAAGRLNWLRAAVLGANDGIVSTAGVIVGVAGATTDRAPIMTAGVAALVAGALSMAVGEYVSVSTQRDTEKALIAQETWELAEMPEEELEELTVIYEGKGLPRDLAEQVAVALTEHDALGAHAEVELQIDPDNLTNPWHAAWASMAAFTVGGIAPFVAALLSSPSLRVPLIIAFVVVALALTGVLSARLGGTAPGRQVVRNVVGGVLAMVVTYGIGHLVGRAL